MISSKLRVAVIGYGYWGPKLVRSLLSIGDVEIVAVSDPNRDRQQRLQRQTPGTEMVTNWRDVTADPDVDAIVVATPVSTHYEIAREALDSGKHALVEKPLVPSSNQAMDLLELATRRQRVLMVGHTFLYHGAVRKLGDLIRSGELGSLLYLDSVRANLGILQDDVNVVWDLAPHDVSIMDFLLERSPLAVSAAGASHTGRGLQDIAYLTFHYPGNLIAHVSLNWLSPVKIRTMIIGGSRKMAVFDDTQPREKVRLYDCGLDGRDSPGKRHNDLIRNHSAEPVAVQLDLTEALQREARDFVDSIRCSRRPQADAESGLRVVRLLELASRSLEGNGFPVAIPAGLCR